MLFGGWFHYHKAAPTLEWFQNVESMMNHHLAGLLGLGCLSWAGHQIHISLSINKLLDVGVASQEIPSPHELAPVDACGIIYCCHTILKPRVIIPEL